VGPGVILHLSPELAEEMQKQISLDVVESLGSLWSQSSPVCGLGSLWAVPDTALWEVAG